MYYCVSADRKILLKVFTWFLIEWITNCFNCTPIKSLDCLFFFPCVCSSVLHRFFPCLYLSRVGRNNKNDDVVSVIFCVPLFRRSITQINGLRRQKTSCRQSFFVFVCACYNVFFSLIVFNLTCRTHTDTKHQATTHRSKCKVEHI